MEKFRSKDVLKTIGGCIREELGENSRYQLNSSSASFQERELGMEVVGRISLGIRINSKH